MTGPIAGLRVVDCSQGTAGPRATGMLADYGADVVWVEPPGGDPLRRCAPEYASVVNRGKRSVELDLVDDVARDRLLALVDRAEVFLESWRPGVAEQRGLGYDLLHARNPALVYVSISGFGEESTVARPGYEAIVQAVLGSMSEQAAHRDGPAYPGFPFASLGAASLAVLGALAALRRAREDGHGRHVCTSLLDGALAYHSMLWGESDASVAAAKRADNPLAMQGTATMRLITRSFECGDGEYLGLHTGAVGAFGRAMRVLGLADRIAPSDDGLDMGVPLTDEQIPIIRDELVDIFKTAPRAEWVERFLDADVCAVEHLRPTEVYDTPQARHNGMVVTVDDPVLGAVEQVAPAAKFSATPGGVSGPAPRVGEHNAVLTDLAGWPAPAVATFTPAPDTRSLLADICILDLGAYYAGPYSSRLLADLGADVVKVEPLAGDQMRGIERPFFSAQAGKRALAANLKDPALAGVIAALLQRADVVHHNLRPGAAERLGLDDDAVRATRPDIVYLHAPGWGSTGPFALRQSFAPMMSGYVGATFEVAGLHNPPLPPAGNEDPGNGMLGAIAILLALLHRDRTGAGQFVENPQLNATMGHLAHIVRTVPRQEVLGAGRLDPLQMGVGPFDRLYETLDSWVCVVAPTDDERAALVQALGVERTDDDDSQTDRLRAAFAVVETTAVVADLTAAGVAAVEPVARNMHAFMNDPEQRATGRVAELPHPRLGNVRELGVLLRVSDTVATPHRLAPDLGEHTDEVLELVGCSAPEIAELRARGVVR